MGLDVFLDPVFGWVLALPLWLGILCLAFILTMIINIIYKFATDQDEMKRLKAKIKDYQKQMKENRSDVKKMQKIQKDAMAVNMKYTTKSLKPTLFTFLPLIIIFAWMNANLAYAPVMADQPITINVVMQEPARLTLSTDLAIAGNATKETIEKQTSWVVSGSTGVHNFTVTTADGASASHIVVVDKKPHDPVAQVSDPFKQVTVKYEKSKPFGDFSLFGYMPGWLFTYIVFSIILSLGSRKLMGIH